MEPFFNHDDDMAKATIMPSEQINFSGIEADSARTSTDPVKVLYARGGPLVGFLN
jgi:hypothetical protein